MRWVGAFAVAGLLAWAAWRDRPLITTTAWAQEARAAQLTCDRSVAISGNTLGTTQIVAAATGQRIYLCGFVLTGGGATTAQFVSGTGTNCATNTTTLTGALELGDNTAVAYGGGVGFVARTAAGHALCWTNGAAVQVSGLVTYAQF